MANEIKYLSYEGLEYFWKNKLKPEIEDDEEVIASSLVDLDTRLKSHTHTQYAATSHTHSNAATTVAGFMSGDDKKKLDGIATGANKYTHPTTHPASMITGLSAVATSGSYTDLSNKPTSLPNTYPLIIQGHTYNGTATKTVSIKELVIANSATATWYYPTFVTGTSATTENINSGFKVYAKNATSTSLGDITFNIGSAATNTVKAQPGFLRIFGESNNGVIRGPQGTDGAGYTVYLPAEGGTLVVNNTSGNIKANSFTENGTSLADKYAAKSHTHAQYAPTSHTHTGYASSTHTHTTVKLNGSTSSSYYPIVFTNAITATNTGSLYIDTGAGTSSSSDGMRYQPYYHRCYCSGGFYELSDENSKNFGDDITVDLDKLSTLSKKYFTWKDDESNTQHIGVSAQEVQELYPEIVSVIDEDGHLSVSYDKLSVVALKGIDVLNDKVKSLEERLERLEKLIKE